MNEESIYVVNRNSSGFYFVVFSITDKVNEINFHIKRLSAGPGA